MTTPYNGHCHQTQADEKAPAELEDHELQRNQSSRAEASNARVSMCGEGKNEDMVVQAPVFKPTFRFWTIIAGLCVAQLLGSLEHSVVVTSGPTIVADLAMGEEYVWISNAFFVCSAAFQPLFGQLCNIFGRRWLMLTVVALFTLGSGVCGGAMTGSMLVAGRAIQGAGSGGIVMISGVILGDLVPLRLRGNYLAVILCFYTVGMTLGPFIGGVLVDTTSWRWVFYMNLPIGGAALVLLFLFLHVKHDKEMTLAQKFRRVDWIGNGILIAGTVAILYALTYAGARHPWASWYTLVPFIVGFLAFVLFACWETWGYAVDLVMPPRLFANRTSLIVAINTFLHAVLIFWTLYFLPLVFQTVFLFSAEQTGVSMLPMTLIAIPGAAISAMVLSRWGKFKMLHLMGFVIFTLGQGLFALQSETTSKAEWATYESVCALGGGIILDTLLPAFQAPVSEADQAAATATWSFIRALGGIWGVAIPAVIFNTRIDQLAAGVPDSTARRLLLGGGAYQHASASFINSFPEPTRGEVRAVYRDALRLVFLASVAFGVAGFLLVFAEREVPLRTELETAYGIKEDRLPATDIERPTRTARSPGDALLVEKADESAR